MATRKILVTGGSGFIGSHVVEHYEGKADVVVLDNFRTGKRENLAGLSCEIVEGSILDRPLLKEVIRGVDAVVHLAALVSVPESMECPAETVDINIHGLLNVLEASRTAGVAKLCFASSAAVYGEIAESPKVETMRPDPRSPYAITKLDGEYYCALYAREGWLETACLRFFNVFGPRQDPKSAYAAAVPIFAERALRHESLTIHGDGEQTRDFIYVKDIAGALAFLAESPGILGVFNAGYGGSLSINQLVERILGLTASRSEVIHGPVRSGDVRHSSANAEKLRGVGWQPLFDLDGGLEMTIRNLRGSG